MSSNEGDSRIDGLFDEAKDLSLEEQRQFLDDQLVDAAELRVRLESLLAGYRNAPKGEFTNPMLPNDAVVRSLAAAEGHDTTELRGAGQSTGQPVEQLGEHIGPYKLLESIGEGGMGVVYMAEQTRPVERRVALKVIKPGMDTGQVIARFEAERQALALMDHPNIAQVLDAGTTEAGRPFFAMELVKGVQITRYCDEQRLATRKRLELFVTVCQAVAHAHQKGIIHRDIKPTNVLVAQYDGVAVPKVIDFGVAKATGRKLTEKTLFTHFGQIVGTLEYMSPEQATFNQLDVDTRSDIYSLGVLLYEMLTGSTPFDGDRLRSAAFDEVLRIIRQEDPPKPSTRLSSSAALPTVAANRRSDPAALTRLVRGDLDWIVMKSLAKERTKRYQAAPELAADVRRYLNDQPIEARRPTLASRARRFVRRNKLAASIGAVALAATIVSAGFGLAAAVATIQKGQAEARESDAQRIELVTRLAKESAYYRPRQTTLGMLLAIEALYVSLRAGDEVLPAAHEALLNATQDLGGTAISSADCSVKDVKFVNNRLIALGDNEVLVWRLGTDGLSQTPEILDPGFDRVNCIETSDDGRWLFAGGNGLCGWELSSDASFASRIDFATDVDVTLIKSSCQGERLVTQESHGAVSAWSIRDPGQSAAKELRPTRWPLEDRTEISRDGRWVAQRNNSHVLLWNLDSTQSEPREIRRTMPTGTAGDFWFVGFDRESTTLVTANLYVALWDLMANDPAASPRIVPVDYLEDIGRAAVSPRGRWLFTGSMTSSAVRQWDLETPNPEATVIKLDRQAFPIRSLLMTEDGKRLITGGQDGVLRIWEIVDQGAAVLTHTLPGHDQKVIQVSASRNGRWIASVSSDKTARLWDLEQSQPESSNLVLQGAEDGEFSCMAVSSRGDWIAAGKGDNSIELWRMAPREGPRLRVLRGHRHSIFSLHFTPDDQWLLSKGRDGAVRCWPLGNGHPLESPVVLRNDSDFHRGYCPSAIDAAGRWYASSHPGDGKISLWNMHAEEYASSHQVLDGHIKNVCTIALSPNGRWMVSGTNGGDVVRLWDLEATDIQGASRPLVNSERWATQICFSGDSRWLAVSFAGEVDGPVLIWDLSKKELDRPLHSLPVLAGHYGVSRMAISPDAKWLFTLRWDNTAHLWDLTERTPAPISLTGLTGLSEAEISPNGRWLAAGNSHGDTILWDLSSEDPDHSKRILAGHTAPIWDLKFSADGNWLVTDSSDGSIRRWMMDIDDLLAYARTTAGRGLTDGEKRRFGITID